jgi:hypothetical protein
MGRISDAVAEQREVCRLAPNNPAFATELERYEAQLVDAASAGGQATLDGDRASEFVQTMRRVYERRSIHRGWGTPIAAPALEAVLPILIAGLGVSTVLEVPCAESPLLSGAALGSAKLIGRDFVPEALDAARARAADSVSLHLDLTTANLPAAELIISRDLLQQLSDAAALSAIADFRHSVAGFLLATTFWSTTENPSADAPRWRPLSLQRPPFSFPAPLLLVPEREYAPSTAHSDKSLGLWRLADLGPSAR